MISINGAVLDHVGDDFPDNRSGCGITADRCRGSWYADARRRLRSTNASVSGLHRPLGMHAVERGHQLL